MIQAVSARWTGAALGTLIAAAVAAGAQIPDQVSGPVLGYVWSAEERVVRPLQGVIGSATIGAPVDISADITLALALDPRRLLVAGPDGLRVAEMTAAGARVTSRMPDAAAGAALGAASRGGSTAALYDAAARQIVIVTGLPAHPAVAHRIETAPAGGPVTRMAVNEDGSMVAYAVGGGNLVAALHVWTRATGTRFVMQHDVVSALALAGDVVIAASPHTDEVLLVRDPAGRASRSWLAGAGHGLSRPVGLAVSAPHRIHVANAGTGRVATFDVSGRLLGTIDCRCVPSGLHPVHASLYRLTDRLDRTLYLFEPGPAQGLATGRTLFVPPLRSSDH